MVSLEKTDPIEILRQLPMDPETSIRIDLPPETLRRYAGRFAIGGVHSATRFDITKRGFKPGSVVPQIPHQLDETTIHLLEPFCADEETPAAMCFELGRIPALDAIAEIAIAKASEEDFIPYYGGFYDLAGLLGDQGVPLVDILHSKPGVLTTIVMDPRVKHHSEPLAAGSVGLHNDNALLQLTDEKTGEVRIVGEKFPYARRAECCDRRLIYNAGPGPRKTIIALNRSALEVSRALHPGEDDNIPDTKQLREYVRNPAIAAGTVYMAVTILPGEIFLLPAGLAAHDGSMLGCDQESLAVIFSGRFPRHAISLATQANYEAIN